MKLDFTGTLLVSDIDGTMITRDFKLPELNKKALERYRAAGGKFTVATGRSMVSARRYYDMLETDMPAIVFNGAGLYDYHAEKFLWRRELSRDTKLLCRELLAACPDVGMEIHSGAELFVINDHKRVRDHVGAEKLPHRAAGLDEVMGKSWNKVLFPSEHEELLRLEAIYKEKRHANSYVVLSSPIYLELLPSGVNKGEALRQLAEAYDIDMKNTYAIGDFSNDIEMIKAAGIGAAPEGAPPEVKNAADYIAAPCEDGAVGDFIAYLEKSLTE
ncbi:MAG TPA: hypothetical protein DEQ02_05870 [Ruminococcaceae bacterium]|nr:hypothetical protein [Oscillospiraceae bacterium]